MSHPFVFTSCLDTLKTNVRKAEKCHLDENTLNGGKFSLSIYFYFPGDIKVAGTACVNALHGRRGPLLGGANAAMY